MLKWKTPYEVLHNKVPSFDQIKVFGSLCYTTNNKPHKEKFEPRSLRCIFLGFNTGQKGYKLYHLETMEILVSRDVVFYEHVLPFKQNLPEKELNPIPIPIPDFETDKQRPNRNKSSVEPQNIP